MPFDNSLILLAGSVALTAATDTAPTSTTIEGTTGARVIDLKGTPAKGLAAVLICASAANGPTDTLTATLEVSDESDFASDVHELGKFDIEAVNKGVILGSEVPATVVLRFATKKRYVRLHATVGASPDSFGTVYCLIAPYPFDIL